MLEMEITMHALNAGIDSSCFNLLCNFFFMLEMELTIMPIWIVGETSFGSWFNIDFL